MDIKRIVRAFDRQHGFRIVGGDCRGCFKPVQRFENRKGEPLCDWKL